MDDLGDEFEASPDMVALFAGMVAYLGLNQKKAEAWSYAALSWFDVTAGYTGWGDTLYDEGDTISSIDHDGSDGNMDNWLPGGLSEGDDDNDYYHIISVGATAADYDNVDNLFYVGGSYDLRFEFKETGTGTDDLVVYVYLYAYIDQETFEGELDLVQLSDSQLNVWYYSTPWLLALSETL
jgi:hypothetical protein